MKRLVIILGALIVFIGIVYGYSIRMVMADPPKRSIVEAYTMAQQALGKSTNEYYCVAAKVDRDWSHVGAWVFTFDASAMMHKLVYVAMVPFNPRSDWGNGKPWPLTEVQDVNDFPRPTNAVPSK